MFSSFYRSAGYERCYKQSKFESTHYHSAIFDRTLMKQNLLTAAIFRSANKGQLRVGPESKTTPGKNFLPLEDNLIPEELESERRCIGRSATVFQDCFLAGASDL